MKRLRQYHADVVAVKQDLGKLGVVARVVTVDQLDDCTMCYILLGGDAQLGYVLEDHVCSLLSMPPQSHSYGPRITY